MRCHARERVWVEEERRVDGVLCQAVAEQEAPEVRDVRALHRVDLERLLATEHVLCPTLLQGCRKCETVDGSDVGMRRRRRPRACRGS